MTSNGRRDGADFIRLHWFDVGISLTCIVAAYIIIARPTGVALILWMSLASLFAHQFEEYRYPGYFPGMMNSVIFSSNRPDRFPLNTDSAVAVNLGTGWLSYFLAAFFNAEAIWLGIAVTMVTLGNFVLHAFVFNIKGRTHYNPGMATGVVIFLPISLYFFGQVILSGAAKPLDWAVGVVLGLLLFHFGIDKLVDWLKDENSPHAFPPRCMIPARSQRPKNAAEELATP